MAKKLGEAEPSSVGKINEQVAFEKQFVLKLIDSRIDEVDQNEVTTHIGIARKRGKIDALLELRAEIEILN